MDNTIAEATADVAITPEQPISVIGITVVNRAFRRIAELNAAKAKLGTEMAKIIADDKAFYDQQFAAIDKQISQYEINIDAFLKQSGETTVKTPNGMAFYSRRTSVVWPTADRLLEWAKTNGVVRTKFEVDKAAAAAYIKKTGDVPEGYEELPVIDLIFKNLKRDTKGTADDNSTDGQTSEQ